jgi:hypothetical protein
MSPTSLENRQAQRFTKPRLQFVQLDVLTQQALWIGFPPSELAFQDTKDLVAISDLRGERKLDEVAKLIHGEPLPHAGILVSSRRPQ